ncbi:MAG: molecular chaperone TorD family protein [Thermodesulfobacteriota bacterium]
MNRSEARSIFYRTLSGCYGPPQGGRTRWMVAGGWIKLLQESFGLLIEGGGGALPHWEALVLEEKEGMACEMMRDHRRICVGLFPRALAPPCDGVSFDGRWLQEAPSQTIAPEGVFCCDRQNGYVPQAGLRSVPDYIVSGFEFMEILTDRAARLAGAEKIRLEEVQMHFFSRFLLPWVPPFCKRIAEVAHLPFYRCLGELTGRFVEFEKNYLGVTEEGDAG